MNGNGELTETEDVIFYVSYGVLTELLRTLLRTTAIRELRNGYVKMETTNKTVK